MATAASRHVAAAEEWLGGVRGGRSLTPLIKESLLHAFEEELWTMDDTSSPEDVSVEVLAVWETIFEAMATWEGEGEGEGEWAEGGDGAPDNSASLFARVGAAAGHQLHGQLLHHAKGVEAFTAAMLELPRP